MIINDIPISNESAAIPIEIAINDVVIVLKKDWAEITEVRISGATWSAISPVNKGFLIFSKI